MAGESERGSELGFLDPRKERRRKEQPEWCPGRALSVLSAEAPTQPEVQSDSAVYLLPF